MILGIETSGILLSVAWHKAGQTIHEVNIEKPRMHATLIGETIESGMKTLNLSAEDIQLVAVGTGPGSYTGLRVGMSYAKGICFGLDIPIIGISGFEILAQQSPEEESSFITLIDAHKNRFYYAEFLDKIAGPADQKIQNIKDIERLFDNNIGIIIDYYAEHDIRTEPWNKFKWVKKAQLKAEILCQIADKKFMQNGADNLKELEPQYMQAFAGVL